MLAHKVNHHSEGCGRGISHGKLTPCTCESCKKSVEGCCLCVWLDVSGRTAAGGAGRTRTHGSPSLSWPPTWMMTQGDLQKTPCPCPWSCTCVWLRSWRDCPHCRTIRSSPPWPHLLLHLCFQILGELPSWPILNQYCPGEGILGNVVPV